VRNRKRERSTPKIDIAKVPAQKLAAYPQKFATVIAGREKQRLQVDEIWSFTAAKQKNISQRPVDGAGDTCTWLRSIPSGTTGSGRTRRAA
jgi:hypothetical protein